MPPAGSPVGTIKLPPRVDQAIGRGLTYLASQQRKQGYWGRGHVVADTSLSLMAFMLQGHVPGRGKHGDTLEKGLAYLIRHGEQNAKGYLGTPRTHAGMYEHGLAVLALSEAWGQSKNTKIRDTLRRAVDVTLRAQNRQGGWRYSPEPRDADMSMTVMQIMALASAKEAGIAVPDTTLERAAAYVISCQDSISGGFYYMPRRHPPGFNRSAAGVLSLIMAGQRKHKAVRRGVAFLKQYPETKFTGRRRHFHYGHYYAIQCMYQAGDKPFKAWYPRIVESLLPRQKKDGRWDSENGPYYGTAVTILVLGVPYRYLPIYQR
jgi:hypothetical protein